MRNLHELDRFRDKSGEAAMAAVTYDFVANAPNMGCFWIPSPVQKIKLYVLASTGMGWDHVSVSHQKRIPQWTEMEYIKRLFFYNNETVMQLHVPVSDHISYHDRCLHLWRPQDVEIPRPSNALVGAL